MEDEERETYQADELDIRYVFSDDGVQIFYGDFLIAVFYEERTNKPIAAALVKADSNNHVERFVEGDYKNIPLIATMVGTLPVITHHDKIIPSGLRDEVKYTLAKYFLRYEKGIKDN